MSKTISLNELPRKAERLTNLARVDQPNVLPFCGKGELAKEC